MNKHMRKPRNVDMYRAILTLKTTDELMHCHGAAGHGAALPGGCAAE